MILVTFAVPQESQAFVHRLQHVGELGPALVGNLGVEEVAVLHTGMGASAARTAAQQALEVLKPARVISSGFAGGLDPALEVGELITAPALCTAVLPGAARGVKLVSVEKPLDSPAEKAHLHTTGAEAVDMESTPLAELCSSAKIPFLVLRVISDAADESLPLPSNTAYDMEAQTTKPLAILRHLQQNPNAIPPLYRFTQRLPVLQRKLADALVNVIC